MAVHLDNDFKKYLFFEEKQEDALFYTVRIASGLSIAGCLFVFITFLGSKRFRKPINRLLFYATIGNAFMAAASMISFAGIYAGPNSVLCQTQGFLVQWFFPADAVWNLAMAINVYLTVFKHFDARRLRRLEWIYNVVSYGLTFVVALVYCFISTSEKGKMYGPAVLYCWVSADWDLFRIALCYGPAWFAIAMSLFIYMAAGSNIYRKRHQLRMFRGRTSLNRTSSVRSHLGRRPGSAAARTRNGHNINKTTEVQTSYALRDGSIEEKCVGSGQTEARIEAQSPAPIMEPVHPTISAVPSANAGAIQQANSTIKANAAAWGYTKVAMLFFVCLMITWVPSTIFRLYSVLDPTKHSFVLAYVAGLVIPLQGFWNFIIYVVTSWDAVQGWFVEDFLHKTRRHADNESILDGRKSRTNTMRTMTTQASVETMRAPDFATSPTLIKKPLATPMQLPPLATTHQPDPKWAGMPYWGQSRETSPHLAGRPPSPAFDRGHAGTRDSDAMSSSARSPATLVAGRLSNDEMLSPEEARVFSELPGEGL